MTIRPVVLLLVLLLGATRLVGAAPPPPAAHAAFAGWVKRTFFPALPAEASESRWDIPADINTDHGRVAANIRSGWSGGWIDLGSARRQYEIEEPFLLILAAWTPDNPTPQLTSIAAPLIRPERWRALWAPVTYADLLRLEDIVQDPSRPIEETRRLVLKIKSAPPFSQAKIQVNPRIEPQTRQLLCLLSFRDALALLAPAPEPTATGGPSLWGTPCPVGAATPPAGTK